MAKKLEKYQKMRDFGETPEPSGSKSKRPKAKALIFVIQKHQASHLHYDFRLEMEGVLKSWAVPKGPSYNPSVKRLAMMTEDHPYDYADFEGVIPAGQYGGGNVIVWDAGTWEFIEPGDDPVKALEQGKLTFRLMGRKMIGEWALIQLRGKSERGNEWLLLKHRDKFVSTTFDVTAEAPMSIVSGKLVEEMGADDRVWQSNRGETSGKAPTVADRLKKQKAGARKTGTKASTKKKAASATRKTPAKKAASKVPAANAKRTARKTAAQPT